MGHGCGWRRSGEHVQPQLDETVSETQARRQYLASSIAYIPMDRRQAMVRGKDLPDRTNGAALFADISGFTLLTEALTQELGYRRGAEELTRNLNLVYDALITEVHRYGGSVVGFSGDAITCWFDGDDGLRATACALDLQQGMGRFTGLKTRSGTRVSLAIKAAVTIGPARRFVVGDPQIQIIDVLAGTILERIARAEKRAKKGEVVVGPEVRSQLGSKLESLERRDGLAVVAGLTCQVETAPWPELPEIENLTEEQVRPWLLPPVCERLRIGQGRFLAELRPAVALFLGFGGLDYDQDDAAGEKLDMYVRRVQGVLARHETYLLQLTCGEKGSYLYAAFGAPLAHDDDPARAVAAALELKSPPQGAGSATGVRIGISQGQMRAGAYGGPTRRTYGVLGDEANVAARLMEKARPGQILVSEHVAGLVAPDYCFECLGPVELKGKKAPQPVYALSSQLPSPQRSASLFTNPLIGREDELVQMERVLESVLAGEGQILRLEGVAGIGKSHLAAEFTRRASSRGVQVAQGACHSTNRSIAYTPWRQVFRALFRLADGSGEGEDPASSTTWQVAQVEAAVNRANAAWLSRLPLLGDLLALPISDNVTTATFNPQLRQESLFALVVEIVQTQASIQPLLLLVEDAHWMDEASLGLTMALGRAIACVPVLLALVHRPPGPGDGPLLPDLDQLLHYNLVNLRELPALAIRALVADRLKGEPSALALSLIEAVAQGNPFFTEELVDALRESERLHPLEGENGDATWTVSEALFNGLRGANCLTKEDGQWILARGARLSTADLGIPDSIHGAVLSRIDRLPEPHKLTAKVASVIGRNFEFDLLAGSHPAHLAPAVLREQMAVLEARDLTRRETSQAQLAYTFRHSITQEVVYQTLLEDQQRELHRAVGETLERLQPGAVERLAYHYSHSSVRDKTLFYLDKAARKAQREYANETALHYYNQALALEEHWEWHRGRMEVLHILGQRDDERAALGASEALSAPVFELAYLWGQYYEAVGEYSQAQDSVERAMAAYQELPDVAGEARCLTQLGWIAGRQGDYQSAQRSYQRALQLFSEQGGCADEKAHALNGLGAIYGMWGRYGEATACLEQVLPLSRGCGNRIEEAQALNNLGIVAFYRCEFSMAAAYHQRALEIRRAVGDRTGEGCSLVNLAQATRDAGDYSRASECLLQALAIHQATGNRWAEGSTRNELGVLALLTGNLPKARDHLHHGLELSRRIGDESGQAYILCNLGQVLRDLGDVEAAEKALTDSMALANEQADKYLLSLCLSHLGRVHLQAGAPGQAQVQAAQALELRRELALRLWMTADLATLAATHLVLKNQEAALSFARQALTILDDCSGQGPEYPQWDYFLCHQVLAAAGEQAAARQALESAYQLVMTQSAKITDPAMRQSFLERVPHNREIVETYASLIGAT